MNLNDIMKGYMDDIHDMISEDDVGGFEPVKKDPDKKSRGDSKRISKDERKKIKKRRKQQKDMERVLDGNWEMV